MLYRPQDRPLGVFFVFVFRLFFVYEPDVETPNFLRALAVNAVDRPRPLQMEARSEDFGGSNRSAEALQQRLFTRADKNKTRRKQENRKLGYHQPWQILFQEAIKSRVGHLEAELVIQRVGHRGEQPLRLSQQTYQPALIEHSIYFAFHARPVNLQQQREQIFHGQNRQQRAKRKCQVLVHLRKSRFPRDQSGDHRRQHVSRQQQVAGAGTQQPFFLQPRQVR